MKRYDYRVLVQSCASIFAAAGATEEYAQIVAEELVETSAMGLHSHGVVRCKWYVDEIEAGRICPKANVTVERETDTSVLLDYQLTFGQVGSRKMVEILSDKASRSGVAVGLSRHSHHVGRLGSYTQKLAERGFIALACVNSSKSGHFVTPWGGREGRLATNPISYAVPTRARPIVLDMSTSMIAEGTLRVLLHEKREVPPGCIQDSSGAPSTDPRDFYGPPMGTILPFGSNLGYKGFGLSLLCELLGGALGGEEICDEFRYLNGLCVVAIQPDGFLPRDRFEHLIEERIRYVKDTPIAPGHREILLPGELDFRHYEESCRLGISLSDEIADVLRETAARVGAADAAASLP